MGEAASSTGLSRMNKFIGDFIKEYIRSIISVMSSFPKHWAYSYGTNGI